MKAYIKGRWVELMNSNIGYSYCFGDWRRDASFREYYSSPRAIFKSQAEVEMFQRWNGITLAEKTGDHGHELIISTIADELDNPSFAWNKTLGKGDWCGERFDDFNEWLWCATLSYFKERIWPMFDPSKTNDTLGI